MTKKYLLFIILTTLVLPAFALDWGVFEDYKQNADNYAMVKFLNKKPIVYHLTTAQLPPKEDNRDAPQVLKDELNKKFAYINLIQTAFDTWRTDTKAAIKNSGRTKEFNDIMKYLDKPIDLIQTSNKNEADLIFKFTTEEEKTEKCKSPVPDGCFFLSTHELILIDPFVYPSPFEEEIDKPSAVLIHELGHYLGLTDQYLDLKNNDATHSTTNRFGYGSSLMGASYTKNLYCDDIDAFINLMDLTLAMQNNGKFSKRAQKGWASFCNNKKIPFENRNYPDTFYKEARIINKQDSMDKLCKYSYDANGNISQTICPTPYNFYNKELSYNQYGLISKAIDEDGDYGYSYDNANGPKIEIGYQAYFRSNVFESFKKEINGKEVWTISPGYNINAFDAQGYVELTDSQCKIHNFVPNIDSKAYNLIITDKQLEANYSYTVVTDSLKPAPIFVKKHNKSCVLEICDEKILKKLGKTECVNLFENDKITQFVADYAAMNYKDFSAQRDDICRENLSSDVINNAIALCDYFKKVDDTFKNLEAQGKTIGITSLFKKLKGI